jgi:hypothetical protein
LGLFCDSTNPKQVLQQPQRARACGSGAKSSADRRPVDPPPVVELKIFDEDSKNDITFSHNANFFLYTTLESARAIAPVRGNSIPAPYPVLTGTPVAGMAYLDRPVPAGYFIFPDLSVRHEGKYRLSFNLFEELKEDKDSDAHSSLNPEHPSSQLLRSSPMAPHAHVHFRLEVKSEPFVVYSAKKFPGLAESTTLSRVVAEQGCRVRIRRDVRMRRRDQPRPSENFDECEDEAPNYQRNDRYTTPDAYQKAVFERARSVSNSSVDGGSAHQYPGMDRRTSSHDAAYYNQSPYQQTAAAAPVPQPVGFNSHLSFGNAPQYSAQAPSNGAPQYNANASFHYQQHQQPQQPSHSRQGSSASNADYPQQYQPQLPHQPYGPSFVQNPHPVREVSNYPTIDGKYLPGAQNFYQNPSNPRSTTPTNHSQQLPPLKSIQQSLTAPLAVASPTSYESPSFPTQSPIQSTITNASRGKRAYDHVFDTTHLNNSVSHGARPEANGDDVLQIDGEENGLVDEEQFAQLKMLTYRRADGSKQHKKIPSPIA